MAISLTMQEFLEDNHISYETSRHNRTGCSTMTAEVSHVPGGALAKGVVLKWDDGFMLAVLPSTRRVDLGKMSDMVGEPVRLASEMEASALFPDCEEGAVPITATPYRIACVVDERLEAGHDVWFEGGDHRTLVHVTGPGFERMMYGMPRSRISF